MKELLAFILPLMTALVGMRLVHWLTRGRFEAEFGFGFRFVVGLAVGILFFSQAVLLCALAGINGAIPLAWLALIWGVVEVILLAINFPAAWKKLEFQVGYQRLLLLLPLFFLWWIFARLSTLEGTIEFDANAFWVFKSKILFLEQGKNLIHVLRQSNLGYAHMDYPMLVPSLYTFTYGAVGGVDEFVNKVWPFWMIVTLSVGILSFARAWTNPRFLPIAIVTLLTFLPATLRYTRYEGGTMPMVFYTSLATLLIVSAIYKKNDLAPIALPLVLAGCFSTKFEGGLFAMICAGTLFPFCLKQGWLKNKAFIISTLVAITCLTPYILYRLTKPVPDTQAAWLSVGASAPHAVLHRFPQIFFIDLFVCFFNPYFFQWQALNDHLKWSGDWFGLGSLYNDQLTILPWLLIVFIVLGLTFSSRARILTALLSIIILAEFTLISLVIACLEQHDLSHAIDFACSTIGRYYYPFFVAWFLGIAAIWFFDEEPPAQTAKPSPPKPISSGGKNAALMPS